MMIRDAFHAVRVYVTAEERLTSIRAIDVGERIVRPVPSCRHCGQPRPRQVGPGTRCPNRRCRRTWKHEVVFGHGGRATRARVAQDATRSLHADLGSVFARIGLWERRVLFAWALLPERSGRRENHVLEHVRRVWPRRAEGWSRDEVRALCRVAEQRVEGELEAKGLDGG